LACTAPQDWQTKAEVGALAMGDAIPVFAAPIQSQIQ
jgi:hypothetical protein